MLPPHRSSALRSEGAPVSADDAVRSTDDDAAASRFSATNLKYLDDPFVSLLYKPPSSFGFSSIHAGPGPNTISNRKPPLINVGTHHRTYAIDKLIQGFLERGGKQIVSLGAGSDTRFWRLMSSNTPPDLRHYVELDFPHLTSPKAQRIARSPKLSRLLSRRIPRSALSDPARPTLSAEQQDIHHASNDGRSQNPSASKPYIISKGGTQLSSELYTLLPIDLRLVSPSSETLNPLETELLPLLGTSLPTLFLAECVFCYMQPEESRRVIQWFGEKFIDCVGVVYEMCGLDDAFGQVMKRNLASRHLSLPGTPPFPTPLSQADRFLDPALGDGIFHRAESRSLWEIRENVIPPAELQRLSKLEILDELEELKLVLSHYCVAWGSKGEKMAGLEL